MPYGSRELIEAAWEACERLDAGQLQVDRVDAILSERWANYEEQRVREAREFTEQIRRDILADNTSCQPLWPGEIHAVVAEPGEPPPKLFYTLKEIMAMKLSDALKAIRSVSAEEIQSELETAKANLENVKTEAKAIYDRAIKTAQDEVKMLTKLMVSKGMQVRKRRKKGA